MSRSWQSFWLGLLTLLFLGRVCGQVMAGIYQPAWLPPWGAWYSGLLPYPWLLPAQLLLLMFMAVVNVDQLRGHGGLCVRSATVRRRLRLAAGGYAGIMLARQALHLALVPEARWLGGGTVPVLFHLVLAAWLRVLAVRIEEGRAQSS